MTTTATAACAAAALSRIAVYRTPSRRPFRLVVSRGSVVDFSYPPNGAKSAIVNAANEGCLGGGGVDGAIGAAGGPDLLADRRALPTLDGTSGARCATGGAVVTGPGTYGSLHVPYVIHAVGPNYSFCPGGADEGDALLSSAYASSLGLARDAGLEAVAFSLLSAGVFRGTRSLEEVLAIGMDAIARFDGYAELREVHMCAFNEREADALVDIAEGMGLKEVKDTKCDIL